MDSNTHLERISLSVFKTSLDDLIYSIDEHIQQLKLADHVKIFWNHANFILSDGVLVKYLLNNKLITEEKINEIFKKPVIEDTEETNLEKEPKNGVTNI